MTENLPEQILEQLRADASGILTHWQKERPELSALQAADAGSVHIELLGKQGLSRATFLVHAGDHDAVLSVFTPDPDKGTSNKRAPISVQRDMMKRYRDAGVPVPKSIGEPFDIQLSDNSFTAELTDFCHGIQVPHYKELPVSGARSMGHNIAKAHQAMSGVTHEDMKAPFKVRAYGLPYGLVHNDLHKDNVIFDSDTHEVAGIIDFERAKYRPFVRDMTDTAMLFLDINVTREPLKFDIKLTDHIKDFMRAYMKERPLNKREMEGLKNAFTTATWRACLVANHESKMEANDGEIVPNTKREKVALRLAIGRDTLAFRSELDAFVNDIKEELSNGHER